VAISKEAAKRRINKKLGKQVTSKKGTKYYPNEKGDSQSRDNALAALYNRKKN
jgi:hypothetical protein